MPAPTLRTVAWIALAASALACAPVAASGLAIKVTLLGTGCPPAVVYGTGGVKITAFEVDHAPVEPALGYRIDPDGHRGGRGLFGPTVAG